MNIKTYISCKTYKQQSILEEYVMIIRQLKADERFEAGRISMICFHDRLEGDVEEKRRECEAETVEDWGAFTDEGKLMAHIINNSYNVNFDGHVVRMGGIGAVSTLPEYRNTGAVRHIFNQLLPNAYKNGEILSGLYPFNHAFYRKFGYDTVCYVNNYEFRPECLKNYSFDGEAEQYVPGGDVSEYTSLYNKFARDYNMAAVRDDEAMREHMKGEYFKNRRFEYLLKKNGQVVAYLIFSDKKENDGYVIVVEDIAFDGAEGLCAILGFLNRFSADYAKISLRLPYDIDLHKIVRSPYAYDIKKTTYFSFMCRVINVQKALELMKKPENLDVVIKTEDPFIRENSGTWHVTSAEVSKYVTYAEVRTGASGHESAADDAVGADLVVDIATLSQLICGAITYKEATLKAEVTCNTAKSEQLAKLFDGRSVYIAENF